jgi:hypothetical protein
MVSYRMFNQQEVQIVIGGVNSPIDLDDLQRNTNYGGLYDEKHETIVAFWKVYQVLLHLFLRFDRPFRSVYKVVNSFDQEQRRALLRFVTSCSRPPLLFVVLPLHQRLLLITFLHRYYSGFKELVPNFCIRDAGIDQFRLPTSSTCVNLLKVKVLFASDYECISHRLTISHSFLYTRMTGYYVSNFCRRSIRELDSTCLEVFFLFFLSFFPLLLSVARTS